MTQDAKTPNPFSANPMGDFLENVRSIPNAAQTLMDIQRKNIKSITQAQQAAMESVQEIVMRQRDVFSQIMSQSSEITNDLLKEGKPEDKLVRSTKAFQETYEHMIQNSKEVSDLVKKANQDAVRILKKRADESIKEAQGCIKPKAVSE